MGLLLELQESGYGKKWGEKHLVFAGCGFQRGDRVSTPRLDKTATRWKTPMEHL